MAIYNAKYVIAKILRKILNPAAISHSEISKKAKCDIGTNVLCSSIDRYSYIGQYTMLLYAKVGAFTSISSGCVIGGGKHPMEWVSMSPVFHDSKGMMRKKFSRHTFQAYCTTNIGHDVWIGANCLIKGGITIGNGAVIGMGSVVTHDVGAYEVWAGNPAKMIRKRFDEDTIQKLEQCKWWEWEEKELYKKANLMNDISLFMLDIKMEEL